MKRREFLGVLGGAAAWPLAARAQAQAMPVIGFLHGASAATYAPFVAEFIRGLRQAGYVDGENVAIEYRWADGQYERLPGMAADLVARRVAVIATPGSTPATLAAKAATTTIPIVFFVAGNPIDLGLVSNLGRPNGNLTGVTGLNEEVGPKRLELLHQLLPAATSFALLVNPTSPAQTDPLVRELQGAAAKLGLQLHILNASTEREIGDAFAALVQNGARGLVIGPDAFFNTRYDQLAALALRHAVPTIYQYREFTGRRRPDELWGAARRSVPACRTLHGPRPQGRESGRPAGAAGDQGSVHHQSEDREGAGHRRAAVAARPRR
jgi:putative tryptophan/tyrosine transport system substrate-binding protein